MSCQGREKYYKCTNLYTPLTGLHNKLNYNHNWRLGVVEYHGTL